jgi:hypothetical protein
MREWLGGNVGTYGACVTSGNAWWGGLQDGALALNDGISESKVPQSCLSPLCDRQVSDSSTTMSRGATRNAATTLHKRDYE